MLNSKIFEHTEGKLVQVPGLPAMYDYEFFPQTVCRIWAYEVYFKPIYERLASLWYTLPHHHKRRLCVRIESSQSSVFYSIPNSTFRECDATIINTSYAYESVSLDAIKQWFSDMQKEIYVLGPHLLSGYGVKSQNGKEGKSFDIETFLGEMLIQHGKGSVFYVRFFPFFFCIPTKYNFSSDFYWHSLLSLSFGIRWWVDWITHWKESTICKWQVLWTQYFMKQIYSIRFSLMHPPLPKFRSNW